MSRFLRGNAQLTASLWASADRVEVRFRGSKGDQMRTGTVLTRVREGPPRPLGAGGGAVDLMIELMSNVSCEFYRKNGRHT